MTDPVPRPCLSVVMPCYNERATIREVVKQVLESPWTAELIIVDDGSVDGTREILQELTDSRVRVFLQTVNQGKGAALRRGFQEATADFVIVQDADLEYDPSDWGAVLGPLLEDKADVVYGSRFAGSGPHRVLYFWHSVGNKFLTLASNMFTNLNLTDMETCYKAFRRDVIQSMVIEEDRFGFEPEITAKIAAANLRVYEVGISYAGRTYAEGKKIGWRDGVRAMYCILRYSPFGRRRAEAQARRAHAFHEADAELAESLDTLDAADNYADWIVELFAEHVRGDILEVGAGHGTLAARLARLGRLTACEPSPRAAEILRKRFADDTDVEVLQCDAQSITHDRQFDTIVMVNVLEHIEDDVSVLAHLAEGLRPGGKLIVLTPAFEALYSRFDQRVGHHRRYRATQLKGRLARAGLRPVELRYVNAPGAVAWFLYARVLGRTPTTSLATTTYDRAVVPVLRRLERGRRPPFGQSILAVAERPA